MRLHHEWHGSANGPVLLLVHGGGSTIATNFGALLPLLADRRVLAVELQGHGRTPAGDRTPSFDASADDVAELLGELGLDAVDVLGFSNGGQVALRLAVRHPGTVRRLIAASAPFRRDGMVDGFWAGLEGGTYADLPAVYRDAHPDPRSMFDLDRTLMLGFEDFPDADMKGITAPTLVVVGDRDVIRVEHAAELARLIPDARLLVVPSGHGGYLGELLDAAGDDGPLRATLPWLVRFLSPGS